MVEHQIYKTLKLYGLCKSEEQFSTDYLGKSKKYFGVCKARTRELSLGAQVTLLERIRHLEANSGNLITGVASEDQDRLKSITDDLARLRRRLGQELSKRCLDGMQNKNKGVLYS